MGRLGHLRMLDDNLASFLEKQKRRFQRRDSKGKVIRFYQMTSRSNFRVLKLHHISACLPAPEISFSVSSGFLLSPAPWTAHGITHSASNSCPLFSQASAVYWKSCFTHKFPRFPSGRFLIPQLTLHLRKAFVMCRGCMSELGGVKLSGRLWHWLWGAGRGFWVGTLSWCSTLLLNDWPPSPQLLLVMLGCREVFKSWLRTISAGVISCYVLQCRWRSIKASFENAQR